MPTIDLSACCCTADCASAPDFLTATVSPNCSPGVNSPQLLNRVGDVWSGGATTTCAPTGWGLTITCTSSGWSWSVADGGGGYGGSFTPSSVSPFMASFQLTPGAGSCCDGIEQTITITE